MTALALDVRRLTRRFRVRSGSQAHDFTAVDDLSFQVTSGGSLAIVGESGSGKTTTARMLIGQVPPSSGTIRVNGHDWDTRRQSARARRARGSEVQIVFQDPYTSLDPRQTVASAIIEVLRVHGTKNPSTRAAELADSVGLDERHLRSRPGALSGGQRQRVAIAKALAASPSVLILDEAVSALDVSIQAQVLNLLADLRARTGMTYLFISHDLAVVRQIADDVLVLQHGRMVEHGPTAEILDRPQHPYTQLLRASVPGPGWQPVRSLVQKGN